MTQSSTEAVKWYRKAAEQGDADAQFSLALCYEKGKGVKKDIPTAISWYEKSAAQGNEMAKSNIEYLRFIQNQ